MSTDRPDYRNRPTTRSRLTPLPLLTPPPPFHPARNLRPSPMRGACPPKADHSGPQPLVVPAQVADAPRRAGTHPLEGPLILSSVEGSSGGAAHHHKSVASLESPPPFSPPIPAPEPESIPPGGTTRRAGTPFPRGCGAAHPEHRRRVERGAALRCQSVVVVPQK